MKTVVIGLDLIGCVPGCKHRQPDTENESIRKRDRFGVTTYRLIEVTPHCARISEYTARRQEIYARADSERDKEKNLKRGHITWAKIAKEYTEKTCPFFELVND